MQTLMNREKNEGTLSSPLRVEAGNASVYHTISIASPSTDFAGVGPAPGWVAVGWWRESSATEKQGLAFAEIATKFRRLADQWREATEGYSSMALMAAHDNYLAIISMGWLAVPLILSDMRDGGGHWYKALRVITGENPVTPEMAGDVQRMDEAWLAWGRSQGLI